jgi:hypothetical protein
VLTKTGEGSIEEFAKELDKEKAQFGYVRVKYQNDEQSSREKFVLVIFIGTDGKSDPRVLLSINHRIHFDLDSLHILL